jgi:hypothetical protein
MRGCRPVVRERLPFVTGSISLNSEARESPLSQTAEIDAIDTRDTLLEAALRHELFQFSSKVVFDVPRKVEAHCPSSNLFGLGDGDSL